MSSAYTLIFQSAKLGDLDKILAEFRWAQQLLRDETPVRRVYGVSGGNLTALAFALALSARVDPANWGKAAGALDDFSAFLVNSRSRQLRARLWNPIYGIFDLSPLHRWVSGQLKRYHGQDHVKISELPVELYLSVMDYDGTFTIFGQENDPLQFQYQWVRVGPPNDAPVADALIAGLSTVLSTAPWQVNGQWYRDARPNFTDAGAIVTDLEAADPAPILRRKPHAPIRPWKLNFITSPFIMHSQNERNQHLLASYSMDLTQRQRQLQAMVDALPEKPGAAESPTLCHINLPYVGSTEAFTNMRQSVEQKAELMEKFNRLLDGQADNVPFDQPANIIYGAGGFSGILAGLVTTRLVDRGFDQRGGAVQQVYGVSAGVLNGFFHAVQIAAQRYPDLYMPAARSALMDLEQFIAAVTPGKIARLNRNPIRLWQGWGNLDPLKAFLCERLTAYTGTQHPEQITFDDIGLPLTIAAARGDGFTDFLGMTQPPRLMHFAGHEICVIPAPVIQAILAGWSMNTYIQPTPLNGEHYRDGGGTFYDIGLFTACLDAQLTNLINIHLDEPEDHTYHIPPRPHLVRIVFDTHNYYFPEERRRMQCLTDLLYDHYRLRAEYLRRGGDASLLPPDFRNHWTLREDAYGTT